MEVQIGAAKINKYAMSESGDTLEVVERPNGGISVVLADGQRSGKNAKRISNIVARKVISLLAEGVRDGPAARAASDYLYALRGGKVLSTLNILSIDLDTNSIVITRNNPAPIYIRNNGDFSLLSSDCQPVGVYRNTRPEITEIKLEPNLTVVAFTDGMLIAGERKNQNLDIPAAIQEILNAEQITAQTIADYLINLALELDDHRPIDDVSVVVVHISPHEQDSIRRMTVRVPIKLK
jgi:serine phosphatase RsbU (regulator of sigma subunit)